MKINMLFSLFLRKEIPLFYAIKQSAYADYKKECISTLNACIRKRIYTPFPIHLSKVKQYF